MSSESAIADLKSALLPAVKPEQFRVYVFGPGLTEDAVVEPPPAEPAGTAELTEHARYLRYLTRQRLQQAGFTAEFGEAADLLDFWRDFFNSANPAMTEIFHARKACGAIVIFPASVGPIAELALFARNTAIAEKTCAIVHDGYASAESFFRQGVIELFEDHNGKTKYVNYTNHEACVGYALRFVRGKFSKLIGEVDEVIDIRRRQRLCIRACVSRSRRLMQRYCRCCRFSIRRRLQRSFKKRTRRLAPMW